jgi:uncharacterized alpha-E superfamily protein
MYRQKMRKAIHAAGVIQYLLTDTQFPRAIAFSLREVGAALGMLPRSGEPIKKLGELRRMLALRSLAEIDIAGLHQWVDDAQLTLGELNALVETTWFKPSTSAVVPSPTAALSSAAGAQAAANS